MINRAEKCMAVGKFKEARIYAMSAVNHLVHQEKDSLLVCAYYHLANSYQELDSFKQSLSTYDKAITLAKQNGFGSLEIKALAGKGNLLARNGDFTLAEVILEQAVNDAVLVKDTYAIVLGFQHLGNLDFMREDYERALMNYDSAYRFAKAINEVHLIADCLQNLSSASVGVEDYESAETYILMCINLYQDLNEDFLLSEGYRNLLYIYTDQYKFEAAHKALQNYLEVKDGATVTIQADLLKKALEIQEARYEADKKTAILLIWILGICLAILALTTFSLFKQCRQIWSKLPGSFNMVTLQDRIQPILKRGQREKAIAYALLGAGFTIDEIADVVHKDRTTVQHWITDYIAPILKLKGVKEVRTDAMKHCTGFTNHEEVIASLNKLMKMRFGTDKPDDNSESEPY